MRLKGTIEARPRFGGQSIGGSSLLWPVPGNIYQLILLSLVVLGPVSRAVEPKAQVVSNDLYRLHFFHTHTGERLNIVYRDADRYHPDSLARLDTYLRDHRTGEI